VSQKKRRKKKEKGDVESLIPADVVAAHVHVRLFANCFAILD
jgi:hypothetical protein